MIGYLVLTPFLAALLAPALVHLLGARASWILALIPGYLFYRFLEFVPAVAKGETVLQSHEWLSGFGINYSFMIDGLSLTFAFLILGIGFFIVIYAGGYLKGHPQLGRFLAVLLAFMGSMLGLVVSDNLITLFVFWELTSITSFLLIGFDNEREASRRAALQALIITGLGGLVMLAGFALIGIVGGTFELSEPCRRRIDGRIDGASGSTSGADGKKGSSSSSSTDGAGAAPASGASSKDGSARRKPSGAGASIFADRGFASPARTRATAHITAAETSCSSSTIAAMSERRRKRNATRASG